MDLQMELCSVELNLLPEKKKKKKSNKRRKALKDSNDTNHDCAAGTSLIEDTPLQRDLHVEPTGNISSESGLTEAKSNVKLTRSQKKNLRRKRKKQQMRLDLQGGSSTIETAPLDIESPVDLQGGSSTIETAPLEIESPVDFQGGSSTIETASVEMESPVDISIKTDLESLPLNSDLCSSSKEGKRKKRKRKRNALENINQDDGLREDYSFTEHMLPEKDSYSKPSVNICLKNESGVAQPNADVSLSLEKSEGKEGKDGSDALQNNGADRNLQMANGKHIENMDPKSVSEAVELELTDMKEKFLVPEKQSGFPSMANTSLMEKHDVHPEVDLVASETEVIKTCRKKNKVKTHRRKKQKTSDSLGNSLENMKEDGTRQSSFDHLEAHTACLSENKLDRVMVGGFATSGQVSEDKEMEQDPVNCLDGEPASKESKKRKKMKNLEEISEDSLMKDVSVVDLPKEHTESKNSGKLDEVQIMVLDALPRDDSYNKFSSYCKDKTCDDLSGCATSCKHVEQKNVEVETKVEENGPSLSHLGIRTDDVDQDVTPKKDYPPQILHHSPERACIGGSKKKLLVLDVNGLLADIVPYAPARYKPDIWVSKKAVFKRPFCDDFLRFCFERFDVGVWSSRAKKNVDKVIDFFMGDSRRNLLFCWNQSHCTATSFTTIENKNKPLVLKELRKLWEKLEPGLPWEKGEYNESNTLLLDDSPYKALRNPAHTAIFPHPYQYRDEKDFSLGPEGDLRKYLEGLAVAENVQKYVELNPFGQRAITESSASWGFYSKIIGNENSC